MGVVAVVAMVFAACGGGSDSDGGDTTAATTATTAAPAGDPVNGEALFVASCAACHGPNGEGIEGLGKPFAGSEFIQSQTDEQMVEFIKVGRGTDDPLNTTGIAMLPRGGNPSLTDQDLLDIVAYQRTLNP